MLRNQKTAAIVCLIVAMTMLIAGAAYAAGVEPPRNGVAAAASRMSNGQYTLRGVAGWPAAGGSGNGSMTLCSGLACGAGSSQGPGTDPGSGSGDHQLYLPTVMSQP